MSDQYPFPDYQRDVVLKLYRNLYFYAKYLQTLNPHICIVAESPDTPLSDIIQGPLSFRAMITGIHSPLPRIEADLYGFIDMQSACISPITWAVPNIDKASLAQRIYFRNDLLDYLNRCLDQGNPVLAILSAWGGGEDITSHHAFMVYVSPARKQIELWDPQVSLTEGFLPRLAGSFLWTRLLGDGSYDFIVVHNKCGRLSAQDRQQAENMGFTGSCVMWTLWLAALRVQYNNLSEIVDSKLDELEKKYGSLTQFITQLAEFLKNTDAKPEKGLEHFFIGNSFTGDCFQTCKVAFNTHRLYKIACFVAQQAVFITQDFARSIESYLEAADTSNRSHVFAESVQDSIIRSDNNYHLTFFACMIYAFVFPGVVKDQQTKFFYSQSQVQQILKCLALGQKCVFMIAQGEPCTESFQASLVVADPAARSLYYFDFDKPASKINVEVIRPAILDVLAVNLSFITFIPRGRALEIDSSLKKMGFAYPARVFAFMKLFFRRQPTAADAEAFMESFENSKTLLNHHFTPCKACISSIAVVRCSHCMDSAYCSKECANQLDLHSFT